MLAEIPVAGASVPICLADVELRHLTPTLVAEWLAAVRDAAHTTATARAEQAVAARVVRNARQWAREAGIEVAPTGRLPRAVLDAWRAAGEPQTAGGITPGPEAGATVGAQAYRLLRTICMPCSPTTVPAARAHHAPGSPAVSEELTTAATWSSTSPMSDRADPPVPFCGRCQRPHRANLPCWEGTYARTMVARAYAEKDADGRRVCWICGQPGAETAAHDVPRELGGDDRVANLLPAHRACRDARRDGHTSPETEPDAAPPVELSPRWRRTPTPRAADGSEDVGGAR